MTPAAAEFWRRVASGAIRLTRAEDRLLWHMRRDGADWDRIAGVICELRGRRRL